MKKVFFMAALMFASIISIKAQYGGGGGGRHRQGAGQSEQQGPQKIPTAQEMADKETQRQTQLLNLTPEQVAKVKALNLNYSQQRLDLMKEMQATKDRDAAENKMKGIKLAQDNELKAILTPEQQAILAKAHDNMGNKQGGRMKGGAGKGYPKGQKSTGAPQSN
jgi:primosomal protein N'